MATSDHSPTVDGFESDTERLESLQPDCPFCGCSLTTGGTEDRGSRRLQTACCRNRGCLRGAAAVLMMSDQHRDRIVSELERRQARLGKGLRARKLASVIRPSLGLGTYVIERVAAHTFDLWPVDGWQDGSRQLLIDSLQGVADTLRVERADDHQAVRVIDERFQTGAGERSSAGGRSESALPDGGVVSIPGVQQSLPTGEDDIEEQHRNFQTAGPLGGSELAEHWPEKEL